MNFRLTILFFFFTPLIFGQTNLVPNSSFEDTIHCPNGYSQSTYALDWTININTSDYFNSCSSTFSTPNANFGFQCPANGNAFCGFYAYLSFNPPYNELIGCQLTNPLITGQKYYLSFKVSLVNGSYCGLDKLGALFTSAAYGSSLIAYPASVITGQKIYSSEIATDTMNWVTIRASFYPDSAYNFVLFGNLADTINLNNFICFDTSYISSYYYIDDVCVSTDSLTCEIPNGPNVCDTTSGVIDLNLDKENVNVFPNPATNELTIGFISPDKYVFVLFDLFGIKRLSVRLDHSSKTVDLTSVDSGVYVFTIVDSKGDIIKTDKLIIIK